MSAPSPAPADMPAKASASVTIERLLANWRQPRISLGDIIDALAERGFGLVMLLLALPTTLPIAPPGLSAIAGFPIAFLALQLALGHHQPWLPRRVRDKTIDLATFARTIDKALPILRRIEKVLKPRLPWATGWVQDRLVGLLITILGLALASPIPFTNIPLSLAIVVLSLSLFEEDGLMTLIGLVVGVAALVLLGYLAALSWATLAPTINQWL